MSDLSHICQVQAKVTVALNREKEVAEIFFWFPVRKSEHSTN